MSKASYFIRKATKEDAVFIRRLIWRVRINPLGLNWRRFVVAVHEHGVRVGCAQVKSHKGGSLELASVAVVPLYRHQGVAETMIYEILEDQNPPIYLTCRSSLVSFYERFGFSELLELDTMPAYFRKVKRVFTWLEKRNWVDPLAVMVWKGENYRSTAPSE
ncbi:MAG: GNAT family N-acetyltransferase [Anaerolineaceae bacterium]|nr:GNAT family N-acetyltransferase [Anaerolineaceae bacterium]